MELKRKFPNLSSTEIHHAGDDNRLYSNKKAPTNDKADELEIGM